MFAISTKNYDANSSDSQNKKLYNLISLTLTHSQTEKREMQSIKSI